jgi:hypothetical protein
VPLLARTATTTCRGYLSEVNTHLPQLCYAPNYLVPPSIKQNDGVGSVLELGAMYGKLLVVTLGVNHVLEQESLAISIWGSASGTEWGTKPLLSFPRKSYCGLYATFLNSRTIRLYDSCASSGR